jgi:hypothetical protein
MADTVDNSTPCQHCGTTALECGRTYRLLDAWCCAACRREGARVMHSVPVEPTPLDGPVRYWELTQIIALPKGETPYAVEAHELGDYFNRYGRFFSFKSGISRAAYEAGADPTIWTDDDYPENEEE